MERKFEFKPEFKAMAIEALEKLSFSNVHNLMRLIRRDGFIYTESESNAIVGFLGEMSYRDVAHIFDVMPQMVVEVTDQDGQNAPDGPVAEAPKVEEPAEA